MAGRSRTRRVERGSHEGLADWSNTVGESGTRNGYKLSTDSVGMKGLGELEGQEMRVREWNFLVQVF